MRFFPAGPVKRLEEIQDGRGLLGHTGMSEILRAAEINVSPEPLEVAARLLPPPKIAYTADASKAISLSVGAEAILLSFSLMSVLSAAGCLGREG